MKQKQTPFDRARRFEAIRLKAFASLHDQQTGMTVSKFFGKGGDFSFLQPYSIGDDVRHIHWIATAKKGHPYTVRHHADRTFNVAVAMVLDRSLCFGSTCAKLDTLIEALLLIGYSTLRAGGKIEALACGIQEHPFLSTRNQEALERFAYRIYTYDVTTLLTPSDACITSLKRYFGSDATLFVLGGWYDALTLSPLRYFRKRTLLYIRDKEELTPRAHSHRKLIDPARPQQNKTYPLTKHAMRRYRKKLLSFQTHLKQRCAKEAIALIALRTDEAVALSLMRYG